ncbi:MAG: hypothetical protein Q8P68_06185 [Candidatus Peregrinibacteria bacterium]|nr:hypothetical protein [Candidatus Peregrinibacteria bacterium]MDZ4245129.1 hypothetical protein [Candidatus Gracilibacteria bacterium]
MSGVVFKQAKIDQELVQLVQHSVSINAMEKTDKEKVILRIFTFPLDKQLEIKDMLLSEREDLAKASAKDMNEHYMKLKELYSDLKAEKSTLEGSLRVAKEKNIKKAEAIELINLENKLQNDDEENDEDLLPSFP